MKLFIIRPLTTSIDTITGTSGVLVNGYDTYTASGAQAPQAGSTFQAYDTINLSGTNNTLALIIDGVLDGGSTSGGDNVALPVASVKGVQTLKIRDVATSTAAADIIAVDAGNFTGLTSFVADRSTGGLVVTNLDAGASVTVNGNGSVTNAALTFSYKTATSPVVINLTGGTVGSGAVGVGTGSATAATINSTLATNSIGAIALSSGNTVTSLTINAGSRINTGTISGFKSGVTTNTITITGAATDSSATNPSAAVSIGTIDSTVGTVDASASQGGLIASQNAVTTKIIGGQGKDVITVYAGALTTGTIDGGAGAADVVNFTGSTYYSSNAGKISNFEILRVTSGADSSYNYGLISGLTNLEIAASSYANTVTNLSANQNVAVTGDNATNDKATTLALADATGAADVINLLLKNATADTAVALGYDGTGDGLVTSGVETLNVTSGNALASTTSNTLYVAGTTSGLKTINVAGDSNLTLNTAANAGITKIDATGYTKNLTATIAAPTTVISVIGGSGTDTLKIASSALSSAVTFNGGAGTADVLEITDSGSTVTDAQFANISGVEKLTIDSTTTTSVTLGGFAQAAIAGGQATITATGLVSGGAATYANTIDASSLTQGSVAITFANNSGTKASGSTTVTTNTLKGTANADSITVTLTTASGASDHTVDNIANITGGAGADTISLTHTGAAQYNTQKANLKYGTTDVAAGTTVANADLIKGFTNATYNADTMQVSVAFGTLLSYDGSASGAGTSDVTSVASINLASAQLDLTTSTNKVRTVFDLGVQTLNNVLTSQAGVNEAVALFTANPAQGKGIVTTATSGTNIILAVTDAYNNMAVFDYKEAGTVGVQASELTLLGTFQAVTGLSSGHLAYGNYQ